MGATSRPQWLLEESQGRGGGSFNKRPVPAFQDLGQAGLGEFQCLIPQKNSLSLTKSPTGACGPMARNPSPHPPRYYWTNNDLYIRAVNAEFIYGYEYLGNSGRLVITPLTDR